MSSPISTTNDIDVDIASKKRGRATSTEAVTENLDEKSEDPVEHKEEADKPPADSVPKKTKHDGSDSVESVSTIRQNMKEMTTADDQSTTASSPRNATTSDADVAPSDADEAEGSDGSGESEDSGESEGSEASEASQESEDSQGSNPESEPESTEKKTQSVFQRLGPVNTDSADWGDFAEDPEEEKKETKTVAKEQTEKPKYTFGATSGFGSGSSWKSAATTQAPKVSFTASIPLGSFSGSSSASPFKIATVPSVDNTETKGSVLDASQDADDTGEDKGLVKDTSTTALLSPTPKATLLTPKEVKTGEEDEHTLYQVKARLFILDGGNWKERGSGTLRVNEKKDGDDTGASRRVVMRTNSVHKLILNLRLASIMKVLIKQEKYVQFSAIEAEVKDDDTTTSKLVSFLLKVATPSSAQELSDLIYPQAA